MDDRKRGKKAFEDAHPFEDEVHGQIMLNQLERDVIDTPEFQRLFRISQLGFIDLAFVTADHTRGAHCIGACHVSQQLLRALQTNTTRMNSNGHADVNHEISSSERILIRLGALLHDISHGPFSHEIEKKSHHIFPVPEGIKVKSHYGAYAKHDDYIANPVLYAMLMDTNTSILARVLSEYSAPFWELMSTEPNAHIKAFVKAVDEAKWAAVATEILPSLLFHLLIHEKPLESANTASIRINTSFDAQNLREWGLGPQKAWAQLHRTWYQPYRHDIIGNTLSADLIDYLRRDCRRLGINRNPDLRLLNSYVLVKLGSGNDAGGPLFKNATSSNLYRCAIDLNDYKRGTIRTERINDIFRLLDLRHEIHEKAVYHRVVQSALAMLSRSLLILPQEKRPRPKDFYGFGIESPTLAAEDSFLLSLIKAEKEHYIETSKSNAVHATQTIAQKLAERRVYRPLAIIPGDRIPTLLQGVGPRIEREDLLREVAAIVDSSYFAPYFCFISWCMEKLLEHSFASPGEVLEFVEKVASKPELAEWASTKLVPKRVVFWATPYKQLYKDPALLVRFKDGAEHICTLDSIDTVQNISPSLKARVIAGLDDSETKYAEVWKLYVFISDGLFYTGMLARLLRNECANDPSKHAEHLRAAQELAQRSIRDSWHVWVTHREPLQIDLGKPMNTQEFVHMLQIFTEVAREQDYMSKLENVSVVAVDQYLHGEQPNDNCRDIRYKFDRRLQSFEDTLEKHELTDQQRRVITDMLKSTKTTAKEFGEEEFSDFVVRVSTVHADVLSQFQLREAAQGEIARDDFLRKLWRQEPGWTEDLKFATKA